MHHIVRNTLAAVLVSLPATLTAVPQVAVINDRSYRADGPQSFDYRGGRLLFILFDGAAFSNVQCPSLPAGVGLFPFVPGDLPCPAGHNAFVSIRFGDRDRDVINQWHRLGSVDEATRIPAGLPGQMELIAAPLTDLPRPSRDFSDRSILVLHDLQTATFSERETSRYEMLREYVVPDPDANGDGVVTAIERANFIELSEDEEERQLRETLISFGNANGYLFDYPIRPFIQANRDVNPDFAPREEIAVSNLGFLEAFPGVSNRVGLTNQEEGFFFNNLNNFGTDFDGDPALLVDFRLPGTITWEGNDQTNLISGLDTSFLQVVENRFTAEGTPTSFAGPGELGVVAIAIGENDGDPAVISVPFRTVFDLFGNELLVPGHALESGEEIFIYETGYSAIDGQRLFASVQSDQTGFNGATQLEVFLDEGLNEPLVLDELPNGGQGVLNSTAAGASDIPDITIAAGNPALVTTLTPHGLANGDSFTLDGTGFSAMEGSLFFAGNTTANTVELFLDAALTTPLAFTFPDPLQLGTAVTGVGPTGLIAVEFQNAVLLSGDQNNFDFPIWPFSFIGANFGGRLLLPSIFDRGYQFPDAAFRLFFGTPVGAQNLGGVVDPARNDLIMRVSYSRTVTTADAAGGQALVAGDLSSRNFEVELCLVDTLEGATKALTDAAALNFVGAGQGFNSNSGALGSDDDMDGDGQTNLYEFAFDVNGSATEVFPPMNDSDIKVSPNVSAEINPETSLCELSVGKRPGVREYLEYYFEEVGADGIGVEIDPEDPESDWELVTDDNFTYKIVSKQPSSGSSFFRACARKNTFGIEITE